MKTWMIVSIIVLAGLCGIVSYVAISQYKVNRTLQEKVKEQQDSLERELDALKNANNALYTEIDSLSNSEDSLQDIIRKNAIRIKLYEENSRHSIDSVSALSLDESLSFFADQISAFLHE